MTINLTSKLFWLRTDQHIETKKTEKPKEPPWISEEHKKYLQQLEKEGKECDER